MTIHSDWSRLFHEECPSAFSTLPPHATSHNIQVGVIDGHLQLMSLHKGLPSWDAFIQYLFVKPIMQLFSAGCPRVVLCFDCYDHVPIYKAMTQVKRVNHHSSRSQSVCLFNPDHGLPSHIPDDPMLYLMNRQFKVKLVEMLCEKIPPLVQAQMAKGKEFIIDYKRVVLYSQQSIPKIMENLLPMGESDVKFCRYVDLYGSALVHAIDGDYLAIALLYYTQRAPHFGSSNQIFIYRQLSSFPTAQPKQPKLKIKEKQKRKVVKCWVDIQQLYVTLVQAAWQSVGDSQALINPHTLAPFSNADAVHSIVFFMLLAGTDFSRALPWLGPKRMWDNLPHVACSLMQAAAVQTPPDSTVAPALEWVVAKLYRLIFAKHAFGSSLDSTLSSLQNSKLSTSVKTKFPTRAQLVTTVQNVMWVMSYWKTHNGPADTNLDGSHGFLVSSSSGTITFSDLA